MLTGVDVDEALTDLALRERTEEVRLATSGLRDPDGEVENHLFGRVPCGRKQLRPSALHREPDARWRIDDDNAKAKLALRHGADDTSPDEVRRRAQARPTELPPA